MAFDGKQEENKPEGTASVLVAIADTMLQMTQEIVKLREAMAPLLERHKLEEQQRELQNQMYAEELSRLARQHEAQYPNRPYGHCDCTPDRSSMLNRLGRQLTDFNFITD